MKPILKRKLKTLVLICALTSFAGVMYQLISEQHLDSYGILYGFPLGVMFGLLELFLFEKAEKRFRSWTFSRLLLFKAMLYTAVIYVVHSSVAVIIGINQGKSASELPSFLESRGTWIVTFYALIVYSLLLFLLQVNQLLGAGVLLKFIRGKYHQPREEERIFMFLDMKSSTTIAERLGRVRFYSLLNELFHEISLPVMRTNAEIYQYVGDEVVLTWEVDDGIVDANCLKTFFLFKENLERNKASYLNNYGVKPEFKAGLHFGKVISAQIGDLKREIVYNGDVLNTTSRIQAECNKYQRDCLVSGTLMSKLKGTNDFQWEKIDTVTLRGKETEVELFSVSLQ